MPRNDLLALSADDLAALTNRGAVKRALREVETSEVTCELAESDAGEVVAKWSDDVTCTLPAGKTANDARCSCVATVLCRHVVRTILAYQKQQANATAAAAGGAEAAAPKIAEPWDPGAISDEELEKHFKKLVLSNARATFAAGILAEVVKSAKPTARFQMLGVTIRFAVPGDVRYTRCDCAETPPCSHVPLAVWAFRELPREKTAGLVSTQRVDLPVPAEVLDTLEDVLLELAENGISSVPGAWKDRLLRVMGRCEEAELIWPAEIALEIAQQLERYTSHDARFAPEQVAQLVGEMVIRCDAIRSQTRAVPQILVRGSASDRAMEISGGRYVGLGCGVVIERGAALLTAYLQDNDSGSIVGMMREFSDVPKEPPPRPGHTPIAPATPAPPPPPKQFCQLAQTAITQGMSLVALGAGQLLTQGGKRSPDHRLALGRARASLTPQPFAWENLRAPALVDDFQELRARLGAHPPASLRPRYIAEDLHVCPIAAVAWARFNEMSQAVEILVHDARREAALLRHPYLARGREGAEALLAALADGSRQLKFVSGQVRLSGTVALIQPLALVFEGKGGAGGRTMVQPWADRLAATAGAAALPVQETALGRDIIADFPRQVLVQLGELLLLGLRRADAPAIAAWDELAQLGAASGFDRVCEDVRILAGELEKKQASVHWDWRPAARAMLRVACLMKLAEDLG